MLSWLKTGIKITVLAIVVLVLGNWIKFRGLTISDQVKVGMSQAEKSDWAQGASKWATSITRDARQGIKHKDSIFGSNSHSNSSTEGELTSEERRKLRELIRD